MADPKAEIGPEVRYLLWLPPRNPPELKSSLVKNIPSLIREILS